MRKMMMKNLKVLVCYQYITPLLKHFIIVYVNISFLSNIRGIFLWFHDIYLMLLEISPIGHGYECDGGRSKCTNADPQGQTGTRKER